MNDVSSHPEIIEKRLESDGPLPVSQRPESIAFGAVSLLMASSMISSIVEVTNNGLSDANAYGVLSSSLATGFIGYSAVRAHKQTVAFNHATIDERSAPETLDLRHFVRSMRTLYWGGATLLAAEAGVIGAVKAVEAGGAIDALPSIGVAATAAFVGRKTAKGFMKSREKQKTLRILLNDKRANEPDNLNLFVSPEYRTQLEDLSKVLVTTERFKKRHNTQ